MDHQQLQHMMEEAHNNKPHISIIAAVNGNSSEITEKFSILDFPAAYELPENCEDKFRPLIEE